MQREATAAADEARQQALAQEEQSRAEAEAELASRNKLNEALQVEVSWSDQQRAKEKDRRTVVRIHAHVVSVVREVVAACSCRTVLRGMQHEASQSGLDTCRSRQRT